MFNYITPENVLSPRDRLSHLQVLYDGGEAEISIAYGFWDGVDSLFIRWNGENIDHRTLGNPQSSGHATWFALPDFLKIFVLDFLNKEKNERKLEVSDDILLELLKIFK